MSFPSPWQELFDYSSKSAVGNTDEQTRTLEYAAWLADYQNGRLSTGITAISELLDDAISADRVDGVVAVNICGLLAAMAGLSVQLATVSSDANSKLANIIAIRETTPPATCSHPLIIQG
ncbi:hypothetical protein C4E44_26370 [Pseudomonas sp. MWU12-2312b]|uniref:hypothetical protein n=1 Tax=Pseudomonas moorei TaxID=395599 RepID=UPI000D4A6786|nr:hypothetical protein [Pseudomonas moorei]PPA01101.1 hypothetical protein C4E44_26370 [Pseudomonas sp. MWU12-2312b]